MMLEHDYGGFQVTRLTLPPNRKGIQDGKDNEYVVCALIHDGDNLAPANTQN